jgi:DNA-binding response OmpR family regulator
MRKGTRPVLLVVDDDASVLSSLDRSLRRAEYDVHLAEGGKAALEMLDRLRPDLVLLDVMMPGGPDGCEVCSHLRAREDMDLVPVVFVTALDTEQDEAKAFAVGGSAFLRKPFELDELLTLVEKQLETSKKWSSINAAPSTREEYWSDWLAPEKFAEFRQYLMDERKSGAAREDEINKVPPQRLYDLAPLLNVPEEQVAIPHPPKYPMLVFYI